MKKKIIFISCIIAYLVLITSICFIVGNKNFESTTDLKQHFCDDYNKKFNKEYANSNQFKLIGEYKKGFLLVEYIENIYSYEDLGSSKNIEIDGIVISTYNETKFYFYKNGKITCGLENIYNKKLVSKDELMNVKNYIDQFKNNNYRVNDYNLE